LKLFLKYYNLCDHGTWSSQTDRTAVRQTDDRLTVTSTALYVASRSKYYPSYFSKLFAMFVMLWCHSIVDDVGDHLMPGQSVLCSPGTVCLT